MTEAIELKVPGIGGSEDVEVIEVLVGPGDRVETEQPLLTLETDKATMEVPSSLAGEIVEVKIALGDKINEGDVIGLLTPASDTDADQSDTSGVSSEPAESRVEEQVAPEPVDETAERGDPAETPTPSPVTGSPGTEGAVQEVTDSGSLPYASPSVRKLARELGVPLHRVKASGAKGRITREDVQHFVKQTIAGDEPSEAGGGGAFADLLPWPKIDFEQFGPIRRENLSRIRKISGANLHRNWVSIPHVTNHEEADITELEKFRKEVNLDQEKNGVKVTMLAFLIKACVAALKQFPQFNASLDGDQIIVKEYYHIGFAVDTPDGLMVPVLSDADKKGVFKVAGEVAELADKARDKKLRSSDMSGGSFSISSLGGIGGTGFTPIINAPEVAILGVSRSTQRLLWNGEQAVPRRILPLSLSWDHRVIDGAAAARFNAHLAEVLTDFRLSVM